MTAVGCPFTYPSPEVVENPIPFYAWPMLEEVVRLEGPVQWNQRVVTEDAGLRGVPIPAAAS
jgi:cytochrome P450